MKSVFFIGQAGCLLPIIILFNLFFGWMFFPTRTWLLVGGALIILFFINSFIFMRRVSNMASGAKPRRDGVIDVEGEIIEEKRKLK